MVILPCLLSRVVGNPRADKGSMPNFEDRDLLSKGEGGASTATDQACEIERAMASECKTPVDETNRGAAEVNIVGAEVAMDKSRRSLPKVG